MTAIETLDMIERHGGLPEDYQAVRDAIVSKEKAHQAGYDEGTKDNAELAFLRKVAELINKSEHDEITRLEVCFINVVDSVEIQTKTRGLYNSQFRTDRPTGMPNIFENSRVEFYGVEGTVKFVRGTFKILWDSGRVTDLYEYTRDELTITGMVPWEEGR